MNQHSLLLLFSHFPPIIRDQHFFPKCIFILKMTFDSLKFNFQNFNIGRISMQSTPCNFGLDNNSIFPIKKVRYFPFQ
jgi:hypothetical protein